MKANLPTLHANLLVRLNTSAVGDAIFVAGCHADKTIVWQWCVVTKTGDQHVYHATAEEASNGSGGARIEGVKSLAQWLGAVSRKPHVAKRAPRDAKDAIDRARAIHGEIVEMVCARGLTQTSGGVRKNRAGVLNAWDDALDALEGLRTLDANSQASVRHAVIVLRDEDKAAAREWFRTPLIFSVHEAKGLEFRWPLGGL